MNINQFAGMKVVVNQLLGPVPKVQLSSRCPCTDTFRFEFNQWLTEFFGTEEKAIILGNQIHVSPRGHELLLKQLWTLKL